MAGTRLRGDHTNRRVGPGSVRGIAANNPLLTARGIRPRPGLSPRNGYRRRHRSKRRGVRPALAIGLRSAASAVDPVGVNRLAPAYSPAVTPTMCRDTVVVGGSDSACGRAACRFWRTPTRGGITLQSLGWSVGNGSTVVAAVCLSMNAAVPPLADGISRPASPVVQVLAADDALVLATVSFVQLERVHALVVVRGCGLRDVPPDLAATSREPRSSAGI
jgi:hypothetical protein